MRPFPHSRFLRFRPLPLYALFAALALSFVPPLPAVVDDAHSMAMEAAAEAVKQGFKVRQEYKKGELKSGDKVAVKYQLYKGNEYWFWLGAATEGCTFTIDAYDAKGNKVTVEKKIAEESGSVRVLPPHTGTYLIVFNIESKEDEKIQWALAHGYR